MKSFIMVHALGLTIAYLSTDVALAAPDDWAQGAPGREDGANHTYYNRGGQLPWRNREGDWRDAAGTPQGEMPFAVAAVANEKELRPVEWDITGLVRD